MPRRKKSGEAVEGGGWQQTIVSRIKKGTVIPLLSNGVSNDLVLGGHEKLIKAYADHIKYPLSDQRHSLLKMTQFKFFTDESVKDREQLVG